MACLGIVSSWRSLLARAHTNYDRHMSSSPRQRLLRPRWCRNNEEGRKVKLSAINRLIIPNHTDCCRSAGFFGVLPFFPFPVPRLLAASAECFSKSSSSLCMAPKNWIKIVKEPISISNNDSSIICQSWWGEILRLGNFCERRYSGRGW